MPACLALAVGPAGEKPFPTQVAGAGFVATEDGVLVTSRRVLARMREGEWLWARALGGDWERATPLGSSPWADVGVARLAPSTKPRAAVGWGDAGQQGIARRFLAIGSPVGRTHVVSAGLLASMLWFDPDAAGGLAEIRHRIGGPGKHATLIELAFAPDLSTEGGAGSPVFDESGSCVGFVASGPRAGPDDGRTYVRPAAFVRPLVDAIVERSAFRPPDLGVRFGPAPGAPLPPELVELRKRWRGGATVEHVDSPGPSNKALWEGDVVLEVDGRPVFGEIYESLALALLRLSPGVPCELVVLRGGQRKPVSVSPI
jgi:S1-C subfamily serine protease